MIPAAATLLLAAAWLLIVALPSPADAAPVPAVLSPALPAPMFAPAPAVVCAPAETPPMGLDSPADVLFENPPWTPAFVVPLALTEESPAAGRSEWLLAERSSRR